MMVHLFCDFDGTVAPVDVGNALFRRFAGPRAGEFVTRYREGSISAAECLSLECEAMGPVKPAELLEWIDGFSIDPCFPELLEWCAGRRIPVTILSDGLDLYIERLLGNAGLSVPFFANHATLIPEGDGRVVLRPEFPYKDEQCTRCGNCKRNHLAALTRDDETVAFAGDGLSDRCALRYADIVFAKNDLIPYCQKANIPYREFESIADVHRHLGRILAQRPRRRREAVMARRERFVAE